MNRGILTVREAAELLQRHPNTIRSLAKPQAQTLMYSPSLQSRLIHADFLSRSLPINRCIRVSAGLFGASGFVIHADTLGISNTSSMSDSCHLGLRRAEWPVSARAANHALENDLNWSKAVIEYIGISPRAKRPHIGRSGQTFYFLNVNSPLSAAVSFLGGLSDSW